MTIRESGGSVDFEEATVQQLNNDGSPIDVADDLNFTGITGSPSFSGHDHSSGGMTAIGSGGLNTPFTDLSTLFGSPVVVGADIHAQDGSSGDPSISFGNDDDTGIHRGGADRLSINAGGATKMTVFTNSVQIFETLQGPDGSAASPGITFFNDTDTGIFRNGADDMRLVANGTSLLSAVSGSVRFENITGTPTMSGHDHTSSGMTAIPNGGLSNSAVTYSAGQALSGGGQVSLGGSATLNVDPGDDEKILYGANDDMSSRYDSGNDRLAWREEGTGDRMTLDNQGNLDIEGNFTESATIAT